MTDEQDFDKAPEFLLPNNRKPPIRVAIADDHTMFRKGIMEILRASGRFFIVCDASNGLELAQKIEALTVPPQVCLLDVNMPYMDGYKTISMLRMKYRDLKFLTLSMYDHEFAIIKMLRQGANGYLLKEEDPEVLMNAIEYIVDHDFYHSELTNRHLDALRSGEDYRRMKLNPIEKTFLELCCTELIYKEIAQQMGVSVRTIEGYRDDMFTRLGVTTRTGLVIFALKNGLVEP
ncbi:MAG: response regulator transcription factor [Bacteroidetes bacterium]|nr:response regulator transcription factor [Bacteroidota bacterium]